MIRTRTTRGIITTAAIAATLALAGCGGSSDGGGQAPNTDDQAEAKTLAKAVNKSITANFGGQTHKQRCAKPDTSDPFEWSCSVTVKPYLPNTVKAIASGSAEDYPDKYGDVVGERILKLTSMDVDALQTVIVYDASGNDMGSATK